MDAICITMVLNTVCMNDMSQWQHVYTEQEGATDGGLGNTRGQLGRRGGGITHQNQKSFVYRAVSLIPTHFSRLSNETELSTLSKAELR